MPVDNDVSTFPIFQEGLFAPFLAIPAVARPAADVSGEEARIRDLLSEYCYRYDAGDVDGVVQLFTPDAVIGNATGTHRGRDAIRQNYVDFVAKRRFGFHYVTNITIRLSPAADEAISVAYLLTVNVTNSGRSTFVAGTYVDRYVKSGSDWRISERRITGDVRTTTDQD